MHEAERASDVGASQPQPASVQKAHEPCGCLQPESRRLPSSACRGRGRLREMCLTIHYHVATVTWCSPTVTAGSTVTGWKQRLSMCTKVGSTAKQVTRTIQLHSYACGKGAQGPVSSKLAKWRQEGREGSRERSDSSVYSISALPQHFPENTQLCTLSVS